VRDYPIADFGNEFSGDVPYTVVQPVTGNRDAVLNALGASLRRAEVTERPSSPTAASYS